jgi:20S proteasome alpha/beta subunit
MRQRISVFVLAVVCLIPLLSSAQEARDDDLVVHGTVNIALGNKNGLVVLTDSMVTSGGHQLPQPAQKLFRLDDETVCAIAGFGWANSPSVPDLNTSSAAIIYEYVRQSAGKQPQTILEKLRTLAVLFRMNLSMIANVLDSTGHPIPSDNLKFQLIIAGYDLDGKPKIAKISLRSSNEGGASMSSVDDAAIWDVGDDLIWRVSGMPDVANVLLDHPEAVPEDSALAEYGASRLRGQGKSLTVDKMRALAERLAFYTSQRHREVGGPNQIAIISAPHTMRIVQQQFPQPPKAIVRFSLVVGSNFAYSSVAFTGEHTIFVRTSWAGMKREIDENVFIGNTFDNCVLTYRGGRVNLGETNRIVNSTLLVGPLIRPDDETVLRLARLFHWSRILRDFSSGAVQF